MRFCGFSFYNGNYLANISPAITTMAAHRSATYRQFICDPIKVHLLEPTREEILAQNKPNENGTYSYVITNDLKGDFTEDEFVTFIQNRFVNLKITCDFTYGFSSEQIGFGIILQFPLD